MSIHVPEGLLLVCAHLSGSIDWACALGGRRYQRPCLPGTANMAFGGERAAVRLQAAHADFVHLYILARVFENALDDDCAFNRGRLEFVDPMNGKDEVLASFAREMATHIRTRAPASRLEVEALSLRVAARLLDAHPSLAGTARKPAVDRAGLAGWQLHRVLERMDCGSQEPSLAELADLVRLSPKHFGRTFKQPTGLTPHQWLMQQRLRRARTMLVSPSSPSLAEVALACGFADQSHFSAAFRKGVGVTPGAYRRQRHG